MCPKDKELFVKSFSICKAEKEQRCCDWRNILLVRTLSLDCIDGKILRLLKTLSEVQRVLYLRDDQRTAVEVLRLHYSCLEHYILMKEILRGKLIALTRERLYEKYMHNLLVHAPIQYRFVSGDSINTEDEERQFNEFKNICKGTTNNKPGHFEYKYIQKHFDDWQSHLKRIADFISFGENIWWEKNDFGPDNQPKLVYHPKIHHFRLYSYCN